MTVRYIVYISRLADPLGPGAVPAVIRKARVNNAIRGITGALIFDGERFCQYIEGDPDEIVRTFTAIERDARHDGLRVLASGYAQRRRFEQWSMAYVHPVTPDLIDEVAELGMRAVADTFAAALARCDLEA